MGVGNMSSRTKFAIFGWILISLQGILVGKPRYLLVETEESGLTSGILAEDICPTADYWKVSKPAVDVKKARHSDYERRENALYYERRENALDYEKVNEGADDDVDLWSSNGLKYHGNDPKIICNRGICC